MVEIEALKAENDRFRSLLGLDRAALSAPAAVWEPTLFAEATGGERASKGLSSQPIGEGPMSRAEKVALFRSLFVGREDVYALRWENASTRKAGWSPAVKGGWANARKPGREHLPLTDDVIESHLAGWESVGLYPLLRGDACRLLVCDFDGASWTLDALAYVEVCRNAGVPAVLERSRSGDGAHVWVFFSGNVAASTARMLGAGVLRAAMELRAEIDLASYDRLFPSQDFMPNGSFGNLIALPLQRTARRQGNTVFLDPATLQPVEDQWAFLAGVPRMSPQAVAAIAESMGPIVFGPGSRTSTRRTVDRPPPERVRARLAGMVSVERIGLPPSMIAALKHCASLHNPKFHELEALRKSTHATPRFVRCYREELDLLHLPRGLLPDVERIVADAGSRLELVDVRPQPERRPLVFRGVLSGIQQKAFDALAAHEIGVLAAPPAIGKTVIACALIARHGVATLVIVDRKELAEQWRLRLVEFVGLEKRQVGQLGGGRSRRSGIVDIATFQTLARLDDPTSVLGEYGMVIVDECHHLPAVSFENVVRSANVRRWVGLTATPYRRDGLEGIMAMHLGPKRLVIGNAQSSTASLPRRLVVHETLSEPAAENGTIQDVFRAIVVDDERTATICADVSAAVARGRRCIVLTQWSEHVVKIADRLTASGVDPIVMTGSMGKKARAAAVDELGARVEGGRQVVLVATGSLIGEGFDSPALDTLFLAFPVSFKGRIVQYVGRVLRAHDEKTDLEVHDYVDILSPVLKAMHTKRLPSYAALGFDVKPLRRNVIRLVPQH